MVDTPVADKNSKHANLRFSVMIVRYKLLRLGLSVYWSAYSSKVVSCRVTLVVEGKFRTRARTTVTSPKSEAPLSYPCDFETIFRRMRLPHDTYAQGSGCA